MAQETVDQAVETCSCQRKAQAGRTDFPWKAATPGSPPCSSGWCRTSAWTLRWPSTSPQPTVIEPSLSASWLVSLGSAGLLLDREFIQNFPTSTLKCGTRYGSTLLQRLIFWREG